MNWRIKHGYYGTRTYNCWRSMHKRCGDPSNASYKWYGAKGIRVCIRWKEFKNFLDDMGPAPTSKHTIDRINNKKGYMPGNCRWATMKEQRNNSSQNTFIRFRGESLTLAQWDERLGAYDLVGQRLKMGWSKEKALTTPYKKRRSPCARLSLIQK